MNIMLAMASSKTAYAFWLASLLLLARTLAISAVTVLPRLEAKRDASVVIGGTWGLIFAFLAIYAQTRPRRHWIHAKKTSMGLVVIALIVSVGSMLISFS